ncbi:MAG: hypothetical protein Q8M23_06980, partial [Bacteroidales bacterium]|nr:hypothetical protein [Bacteroidales bacterium]
MIDFYKHLRRIADCPSKLYKNFRVILLTFFTVNSSGIRLLRMLKASGLMLGVFFAFILLVVVIVVIVPDAREMLVTRTPSLQNDPSLKIEPFYERVIESTDKAVQSRTRKYNSLTPNQQYLVVNTTANHFFLYRGNTLIRQGFC